MNHMADSSITKSDFLAFLDAPMHLWALKHGVVMREPSPLQVLMMNQGYLVEEHARTFLEELAASDGSDDALYWQRSFDSGSYTVRTDALIHHPHTDTYDLYEIKSGTALDKIHIMDAAFQYAVLSAHITVSRVFILHLNREYVRQGELDLSLIFLAEEITEDVMEILLEIQQEMPLALEIAFRDAPDGIPTCSKPKTCPCPALCHPGLQDGSIHEVPNLHSNKKRMLQEMGVSSIEQIPQDFPLSEKQRKFVDAIVSGKPYADLTAISWQLSQFTYPYYFLDYESCISAIPLYDGYHPQQQIVFQYSLHRIDREGTLPIHTEFLDLQNHDPSAMLLSQLQDEVGDSGTVFVWNKTFEMGCNNEMALLRPEYALFLAGLNARIFDLADIIKNGWYLHPGFKGGWSIKSVLPVMVPALSYQDLEINNGQMASTTWWDLTQKNGRQAELETLREGLLRYCQLDTLAMVKILDGFIDMIHHHSQMNA
jgi:hypothetical protein